MNTSVRPPRVALWLLGKFGPVDQEALTGDLFEEFARRRSAGWVWGQVVAAITSDAWNEFRRDPRQAVSGILIGWLFLGILSPLHRNILGNDPLPLSIFVWRPVDSSLLWLLSRFCAPAILSGALLWDTFRSTGTLLAFIATIVALTTASIAFNAYALWDASASERALYISTLPTVCLLGFVLLPLCTLLGALRKTPPRHSRATD